MNPNEQRIAIAEACGWKHPNSPESLTKHAGWWGETRGIWWINPQGKDCFVNDIPDYLNDLNATHEAEKALIYVGDEIDTDTITAFKHYLVTGTKSGRPQSATAAERSEALLKAIGKFTP